MNDGTTEDLAGGLFDGRDDGRDDDCDGHRVAVLLPLPLATPYDYLAAPELGLARGDIVRVPFGHREVDGVVWGPGSDELPKAKLKPVARRQDVPRMSEELTGLIDWVSSYTLAPPGSVLRMAISVPAAFDPPAPTIAYARLNQDIEPPELRPQIRMTPARERVLRVLADGPAMTGPDLAREAAVGSGVIKGLVQTGAIARVELPAAPPVSPPEPDHPGPALNTEQQTAVAALLSDLGADLGAGAFSVSLLDGVTGSGKTEVYFEAVAEALRAGRQVLVLLPEIALSAQWLDRFRARFGTVPAEWHSDLTQKRRRETWRAVAEGTVKVVVGARSSLFLPFRDLGLIIVDEEHEQAFKQEDGVRYQARDMAVVRASLAKVPIVLASATPSLESLANVERGRYRHLRLRDRHGAAEMPDIIAVDLKRDSPERGQWLSPPLVTAIAGALDRGEQSLLFLNRRGYAPLTLCQRCGFRMQCPNCTAWLVEHRLVGRLQCHHCGLASRLPKACPDCGTEDSFVASGPGIERLAEEVMIRFPAARFQLVSSDTLHGPAAAAEFVRSVREREVDIVLGTQIVAKGYDFPHLTVVGVVDADLGLAGGDLRAAERTYQLLEQVSGRAGRHEHPGTVLLQTHHPDAPVLQALVVGDRDSFLAEEMRARREAGMPPFGRLVAIIVSAPDADLADQIAISLGRSAPRFSDVLVLGPAPAPLALLRGRHRRRLLLKTGREVNVQKVVRDWLAGIKIPSSVRVAVDIDPYGFL